MKKIIIINGANLNLIGRRQVEIYGNKSFDEFFLDLKKRFENKVKLEYFQSNHEGDIIDKIHQVGFSFDGIIINPGAYTHYSYSILDALFSVDTLAIEVHISDIDNREDFRKLSITKQACISQIKGKGLEGYALAIEYFLDKK